VEQQFVAQDTDYRRNYPGAAFDLILLGHEPVGRLYVDRRPDSIHILDIAVLPEFRNRGIGTILLRRLIAEAAAEGRRTTIHVERFNPATGLYRRLGFEQVADEGVYLLMELQPPDPAK
jgi:ribosomal protein S18 acetylase RimI-like enzyme